MLQMKSLALISLALYLERGAVELGAVLPELIALNSVIDAVEPHHIAPGHLAARPLTR